MNIFVHSISGKTLCINRSHCSTVYDLKLNIEQQCAVSPSYQKLIYSGRELDDMITINSFNDDDINIFLELGADGGAKKRKKKNYTTPKKVKHKKKKEKLLALKFYKVDDNGKVTRLRRECLSPECGAGVFMAAHFDRQYCGKCGTTFVFTKETT